MHGLDDWTGIYNRSEAGQMLLPDFWGEPMAKRAVVCSSGASARCLVSASSSFIAADFDIYASAELVFDEIFNDGGRYDLVILDHCDYDQVELETASLNWPAIEFVVIDSSSDGQQDVYSNIIYLQRSGEVLS